MNMTFILNLVAAILNLVSSVLFGLNGNIVISGILAVAAFGFLFSAAFWYDKK